LANIAIGIDLGTTSACAAEWSKDGVRFLSPVPEGIPSVLALDEEGQLLIGEAAKRRLRDAPEAGISTTKRLLGKKANTVADQVRQLFTYDVEDGEDDTLLLRIQDEVLTLQQVTAAILGEVKRVAESHLEEPVQQAVITVPAYFNERQRAAVEQAAQQAGLRVLSLLNEPTAAALVYGHGKRLNERVAVFDLGGGTLDIAVVDIQDNVFEVVAAGGDTFLGGVDFDETIAQWALAQFLEAHPVNTLTPFAIHRLRRVAEEAKIDLSEKEIVPLFVPILAGGSDDGLDFNADLSREDLEALTEDLVKQCIHRLNNVLSVATDRPISAILVIGGQSQMPCLHTAVISSVGLDSAADANPYTSVASGAAIFASSLAGDTDLDLTERLNLGISIALPDGSLHRLFQAGDSLPSQCSKRFTTHEAGQEAIFLDLFQGNADRTEDAERLGNVRFGGLRDAPAGQVELSVRFKLAKDGQLHIRAIETSSGERVETSLDTRPPPTPTPEKSDDTAADPSAPPPLRMALPGLADLQYTLEEEALESQTKPDEQTSEFTGKETAPSALAEEESQPVEPQNPPQIQMPELPQLSVFDTPASQTTPIENDKPVVQLGSNKPYPLHLSLRDWIRDFFGGLFGN